MSKPIKNPMTEFQCQRIARIYKRYGKKHALKAFNQFMRITPNIVFWEVIAIQDRIGYLVNGK